MIHVSLAAPVMSQVYFAEALSTVNVTSTCTYLSSYVDKNRTLQSSTANSSSNINCVFRRKDFWLNSGSFANGWLPFLLSTSTGRDAVMYCTVDAEGQQT